MASGLYVFYASEITCSTTNRVNNWIGGIDMKTESCSVFYLDIKINVTVPKSQKMKKIITISFFIASLFIDCYSQPGLMKDYVITNNNDTIFGLIKSGGKKENFLKCVFIKDNESEKVIYNPNDIKAYRFADSKYYVSRKIKSSDTVKIFLEIMFDGIVDLYYYYDDQGDHYFISKQDSDLAELKNEIRKVYIVTELPGIARVYSENTPTLYEKESKEYIGLLKTFLIDSPTSMKKAESILLSHNPLIKIAEDYHNEVCTDENCIIYAKKKVKIEFSFGPIIGVSFSEISFYKNSPILLFDELPSSTGMTYGAFINLQDPFVSEKLSIQLELGINQAEYSSDISTLKLSTLKVPVLVKYTIPFKRVQPSATLGLMINKIVRFDSYSVNYSKFEFRSGTAQYGFTGGIETELKFNSRSGLFLQLRYEYCVGQHFVGEWDDRVGNFGINLNNINLVTGIKF